MYTEKCRAGFLYAGVQNVRRDTLLWTAVAGLLARRTPGRIRGECKMERMKDLAYYNGTVTRIADMMIPANDRGFYFGDGIYEVAMVFHRRIFALEEHLDRMERSAAMVRIELPMNASVVRL